MTLPQTMKKAERLLTDNSATILTALAVAGTLTTAYLSGTASFKAAQIIRDEQLRISLQETGQPLEDREKFDLIWKLYMPAAGVAALTVTSVICVNRIGTRRAAAMAAAYTISERAFVEYREKVVEKIGKNKEEEVRTEVARDRVTRQAALQPDVMFVSSDDGKVMCHDSFSNQFFKSDMETLRKAQNDINAQVLHHDSATVSDFYDYVKSPGLQHTSVSDDMGWNTDKLLEVSYTPIMFEDKVPCISIDFATVPIRNPWQYT